MQNDIRAIYEEMCDTCKKTFKKIILAIRNDRTKDVNDLLLFFCVINPTATLEDDNGVMPLAFINCKDNKYTFFWKNNLLDSEGNSKVPIINETIELSQATIDKIPTYRRPALESIPNQKGSVITENIDEYLPSIQEEVDAVEVKEEKSAVSRIKKLINNNDNEKLNNLVVSAQPVPNITESVPLTKESEQNSMVTIRKTLYMINRKMQFKIWSIIVILAIAIVSFGIGTWQLYSHLSKNIRDENGVIVGERTNITLLGGDLSKQVIEIEDQNNWSDLYGALLTLEVGPKNEGKLEPKLLEAINDRGTILTFKADRFKEDKIAYAATIIINADKSTNFYGITHIAVQAKSKRISIISLGTNLRETVVEIKSDMPLEVLKNILTNSVINSKLSNEQKTLLKDAESGNKLVLKINESIDKTANKISDINLAIISDNSPLYKGTAVFSLKVKWTT